MRIKRILDICTNYGIIPPTFEEVQTGFRVSIFKEKIKSYVNVPENVPENVTENRLNKITEIIEKNDTISMRELSDFFDVDIKTIKRDIAKLKKQNKTK